MAVVREMRELGEFEMSSRTLRSSIFPAVMLVAAAVAAPASAEQMKILASTPTSTLTVGNLQYSIGTCTYTGVGGSVGAASVHNCASGDDLYLVALAGPGSAVEIERLTGGGVTPAPILQATGGSTKKYDLSIQLVIKVIGTHTTVTQGALILAGSVTGTHVAADLTKVTAGETITQANHASLPSMNTSLTSTSATSAFKQTQAYNQTFSTSKDLKISANAATIGSTLTLNSVIQRFTPAPEPAAIGAFTVGLLGVGAIRRRGRAKTASA